MLHKTRGIILQTIPYSDSSIIARVYTELFGLQSYMVSGARRKRSETKVNALQPLSLVEMVTYHKEKRDMNRVKELKPEYLYTAIPYDIRKSSIALFLNEMVLKSIREVEANSSLFEFLHSSLKVLDLQEEGVANFHLVFLMKFSRLLGFHPQGAFSDKTAVFDLQSGLFSGQEPTHPYFLPPPQSRFWSQLAVCNYGSELPIDHATRRMLLEKLILYYELHISTVRDVISHRILEEVVA